jgi:hypothetical protein
MSRLRHSSGVERLQLKWIAYSGAVMALALSAGGVAANHLHFPLYVALMPFEITALTLPLAIGVAILRYRLYDIDLIINRTLVYIAATATVAAAYAAMTTLAQRAFIASTGQKSDAAYVLTAFAVVAVFSPLKDWIQRGVDARLKLLPLPRSDRESIQTTSAQRKLVNSRSRDGFRKRSLRGGRPRRPAASSASFPDHSALRRF